VSVVAEHVSHKHDSYCCKLVRMLSRTNTSTVVLCLHYIQAVTVFILLVVLSVMYLYCAVLCSSHCCDVVVKLETNALNLHFIAVNFAAVCVGDIVCLLVI